MLPCLSVFVVGILFSGFYHTANGAAVMSVDLGSEWMKIGVVSPGVPMEIALNKESKRKTPSVIAFRDGVRTFGEDAQSTGVRFPANSYKYLIHLLGKEINNPIVELYKTHFPYYTIVADGERNTVAFKNGDDVFSVEELVAQILFRAKEFAEASTAQTISECVLIVPGFFGQTERLALLSAAQLANLKVLQLINDYAAVALNYGVFRRAEINETAQYYLFYDMGAQKTSAAVVSYQMVKDRITKETNPVIQVLGVGYDRTLGGLDIQLRLRDYLANEFNKMGKTKTDVTKNPRAMAKLFKEAGRVKNVLSANADHFAQVENVLEDHDFKLQVTRDQLQDLCKDLWPRVGKPLEQALKMSGLPLDLMNQVILFGGGTRVPKVQEILKDLVKQELGKNLNADEAAAIGAVYRAADLATGFKVKKFVVKDAVVFPIQLTFERNTNDGTGTKYIKRTLFGMMNSYPQKKLITFNKHSHDFSFLVNYADLDELSEQEIKYIGNMNISHVDLKKISEVYDKHAGEGTESKGIKAHFAIDDSGVFEMTGVDFVFEKQAAEEESSDDDESTLSKLGSTISKLFSSDTSKDKEKENEPSTEEPKTTENTTSTDTENKNQTTKPNSEAATGGNEDSSVKNKTLKLVTIKEPVQYDLKPLYVLPLIGESYQKSADKIKHLNDLDKERTRRELALNALESFVIEAEDRLNNEEYANCATEDEVTKILTECSSVSSWLYEDGEHADADTYEKKLKQLKKLTKDIYSRHWEHIERPEAIKALDGMIEGARKFLETAKNLTKDVNPDKDVFTKVEIEVLQKTIDETMKWKEDETVAQDLLKLNEPVRLTVKSITEKMSLLDREVKYLVNKIKYWKPPTKKPTTNKTKETDTESAPVEETTENASDANPQDQVEEPTTAAQPEAEQSTSEKEETVQQPDEADKSHAEL